MLAVTGVMSLLMLRELCVPVAWTRWRSMFSPSGILGVSSERD
ncbi:protein of unknown function [Methylorubrum extorquens]|uniref:Uncharacterized protein n=1 Tax=Methylorubrum extorquens TaxID=408 RepID=A0A2N9AX60_METEX|nr:protein of unknown function [Methylorubrum extorquens]